MVLPPGFTEDGDLRDEFDTDLDEDWSDEDLEEEPIDLFGGQNGELAANGGTTVDGATAVDGATSAADLLEEEPPGTADEAVDAEASGDGVGPQTESPEEETA